MKYSTEIQTAVSDPEQLEVLYHLAQQEDEEAEFRADIQQAFDNSPDNLLLSAWHSRFVHLPLVKPRRRINWVLAVVLGVAIGLILWFLSAPDLLFAGKIPYPFVFWAPIATILTSVYLVLNSKRNIVPTLTAGLGLVLISVYVLFMAPKLLRYHDDFIILMLFQLPLLCWIALGIIVMGFRSNHSNRFAFLIKSIEVMIAAGVYLIFGVIFGMITLGMFSALNIIPPDELMRLVMLGGLGLITTMAVATMYDPQVLPEAQDFNQGLSKFIFTMLRLLLPLTLIVLVIYIFVIPFNFMAPFKNRDLLIIYNVMQFAIIGLLIGATPMKLDDLSPKLQLWLRRGLVTVVVLALIISLYALSAVIYRTVIGVVTLNRLTIIGWNIINIAVLVALAITQIRKSAQNWNERFQVVFSKAATAYLIWSLFLVIALPLIFK